MTKTTMTYAIPPEPDGPVWDKDGGRWDISPVHGLWCGPGYPRRTWGKLLWHHGPLTNTEPEPVWPTAPHVWWEGEVWVRGDDGEYQTAGDHWAKSHLDSLVQPVRDGARRFAREAVPVTLVPTEAWEAWKSWVPSEAVGACAGDRELVNAVDSLAQEVAR